MDAGLPFIIIGIIYFPVTILIDKKTSYFSSIRNVEVSDKKFYKLDFISAAATSVVTIIFGILLIIYKINVFYMFFVLIFKWITDELLYKISLKKGYLTKIK